MLGIVGCRPEVLGRILHSAVECERLHTGKRIKLYGYTENASCKSAYNGTFHSVIEIIGLHSGDIGAFGTKGKYVFQLIRLFCINIVIHKIISFQKNYFACIVPHIIRKSNIFRKIIPAFLHVF